MASVEAPAGGVRRALELIPDEDSFHSSLHTKRTAAMLGIALGVSFLVCFLTGLLSHAHQHPTSWLTLPARPAGFYRFTQGLHVTTGIASIPLLLAKLWTVYPHLWARPLVRSVAHGLERISLLPLVAGSVFLLFTGTINIAYWYDPMRFSFTAAHYWAAWITIGAMVVHIGAKSSVIPLALSRRSPDLLVPPDEGLDRRGFLAAVAAASGVLVVSTVGQTAGLFRRISVLAPRQPDRGPQGHPINRAAKQAGITPAMTAPAAYSLTVEGRVTRPLTFTLDELATLPQHETVLPIACVEGWSYSARWRGVQVRELLARAGAPEGAPVRIESLEPAGAYRTSPLNHRQALDRDTVLALELEGQPLAPAHGFPLRLVAPNRPGVQQTKWVNKVVVL